MKFFPKSTDFIDIHSHNTKLEEGVFRIHNIFTSDYAQIPVDRPVSIGLHPWHINEKAILELPSVFDQAGSLVNFMAVGEAGLDRIIPTPIEQQIEVFRTQIELSAELKKPLIIHCVKAFRELLELRKEYGKESAWIVHGFNAGQSVANDCIRMGIYISLSRRLFRIPEKAVKICKTVPISMVFAETDDDTVPISEIYNSIAGYYQLSLSEVKRNIFENFRRCFKNS